MKKRSMVWVIAFLLTAVPLAAKEIRVGTCPNADAATIQAGIDLAAAGDVVIVCPGIYGGGIVIDKPGLKLKAEGPDGAVKIVGTGATGPQFGITVIADGISIEGFEIYGYSGQQDASGIFVGGLFAGDTENPADGAVIRHNVIHDNGNGVYLWQSNDNRVEENEVYNSADFTGSEGTGILSFNGFGDAQVEAANISGRSGKNNKIAHNAVYDNDRLGIFAGACTEPAYGCIGPTGMHVDISGTEIEHNELWGNGRLFSTEAIGLLDAHGGKIAYNDVHDNHLLGIFVNFSDAATIEHNKVLDNPHYGILTQGGGQLLVAYNEMTGSAYHGIYVLNVNGGIRIANNKSNGNSVLASGYSGIRIAGGGSLEVVSNETDGNGRGIRVTGAASGAFEKNSAKDNLVVDLEWDGTGTMTFSKNRCDTALPSKAAWNAK